MDINERRNQDLLEKAYYEALDNELAEGADGEKARRLVVRRAAAYADNFNVKADELRAFAQAKLDSRLSA